MQTLTIRVAGRDVTIDPSRSVVLGSGPTADIPVAGQGVAPQHCRIRFAPQTGWLVEDISGGWGMTVDGQPAQWRAIGRLTSIQLGRPGVGVVIQAWPVEAAASAAASGQVPAGPPVLAQAPAPSSKRNLWIIVGVVAAVTLVGIAGVALVFWPLASEPRVQPTIQPSPTSAIDPALEQETVEAIDSIDDFWATEFPAVFGVEYVSPTIWGGYVGATGPSCGGSSEGTEFNAFYCWEPEDFIAWDWNLFSDPDILAVSGDDGDAAVWFVLAHEWGHAIQARTGSTLDPGITMELQADCYTGSFFRYAAQQGYLEEGDSAEIIATLSKIGDESPVTDPQAHGNAEERSFAYLLGRTQGTAACVAEYGGVPGPVSQQTPAADVLDHERLASQIAEQASEQTGLTVTVTCPAGVPVEAGRESFCELTDDSGATYLVRVVQEDNEGNVVWELITQ